MVSSILQKSVLGASIHWRSTNLSAKKEQCRKEQSHDAAFNVIYDIVESDVVKELKIVRLDSLCKIYIEELERWGEPNRDFRGSKLKDKLSRQFGSKLCFTVIPRNSGKFNSFLLYSEDLGVESAIQHAFNMSREDRLRKTALKTRKGILETFSKQAV